MSEPAATLGGVSYRGFVEVREQPPRAMITLRGDLTEPALARALRAETGVEIPARRGIGFDEEFALAWMSPDELLLIGPYTQAQEISAALTDALARSHALVVDVSDARVLFELRGREARSVLAKLAPVDMAGLSQGEIRRSRLAQVPAAFWLRGDAIELICFRSVARYVFGLLSHAARPGAEVGLEGAARR